MMHEKGKKSENTATIRLATEQDYDAVERIMKQVHRMHVSIWIPYCPATDTWPIWRRSRS